MLSYADQLKGLILDEENQAIPGVQVMVQGTDYATFSNGEGRFNLTLPAGTYKVTFTRLGFATLEKKINVRGITTVNISLQTKDVQLSEVSIRASKKDPAYAIIRYAHDNDFDIIWMETHARSGIAQWVFGSVTSNVLHNADMPVLTLFPDREPVVRYYGHPNLPI